jgi:hypothetical protein
MSIIAQCTPTLLVTFDICENGIHLSAQEVRSVRYQFVAGYVIAIESNVRINSSIEGQLLSTASVGLRYPFLLGMVEMRENVWKLSRKFSRFFFIVKCEGLM